MSFPTFSIAFWFAVFSPLAGLTALTVKVTIFSSLQGRRDPKAVDGRRMAVLLGTSFGVSVASWLLGTALTTWVLPQAWFPGGTYLVVYFVPAAALTIVIELALSLPLRQRLVLRKLGGSVAVANLAGHTATVLMITILHGPGELFRLG